MEPTTPTHAMPFEDPFVWFDRWLAEARRACSANANAMAVATVDAHGRPSCRQVLLKEHDRDGLVFYTNYDSQKAVQIDVHQQVALNFYWRGLERQIRVRGRAERVGSAQSDAYFASRSRAKQIGAWASRQSRPLDCRQTLQQRVAEFGQTFGDQPVPRPDHWGGYRVAPDCFEFWQARADRLHDRWRFVAGDGPDAGWQAQRLYP